MDQKHPKTYQADRNPTYVLFRDHERNTKKFWAKSHKKILSYLRHGKTPKMAQKNP